MKTITVDDVITIHDKILQITKTGCPGVDRDRLDSVIHRIDQQIQYNNIEDLYTIAAWYGVAIAKGHAFTDGNKRTALTTMLTFLKTQGVIIGKEGLDDLMVDIVKSTENHTDLAIRVSNFLYENRIVKKWYNS